MRDDHFKFLGKGLVKDISDSYAKMLVKQKFNSYTALIDGTLLSRIEKLWIWDSVAISSDGAGVGYGVWRKWSRPQDKHEGEREAMLHVFGEIAKENCLVKVMSKPLAGEQVSTVVLHGKPDEKRGNSFCGWLAWRNVVSLDLRWNRILQKQDSSLRFVLNAVQDSLLTPS